MFSVAFTLLLSLGVANEPPVTLSGAVLGSDGQPLAPIYIEAIKQPNAMVVVAEGPPALRFMKRRYNLRVPKEPAVLASTRVDESSKFVVELPEEAPEFGWQRTRLTVWAYTPDFALKVHLIDRDWPRAGLPLSITLPRAAPARIKVTDANGQPVAGARVRPQRAAGLQLPDVIAEQLVATTDVEGRVTVGGPAAKDLGAVRIESDAYGTQWVSVPRPDGDNPATIALAPVGRLTGRLTADDPSAVRHRKLHVATWRVSDDESAGGGLSDVVTDDDGNFEVTTIAAGTLGFNVDEGAEPVYLSEHDTGPQVEPDKTTTFDIRLKRAVLVTQEVRDRDDGGPIAGVRVVLNSWDPKGAAGTTDKSGRFAAYVLPGHVSPVPLRIPPPYYFPQYTLDGQAVHEDSETITLNPIRLTRGGTVRGRVVDQQQHPLGGAEVVGLWPMPSRGQVGIHTWSNEKGEFSITGVDRDAEVRLWVQGDKGVLSEAATARPDSPPATLVIHPEEAVSLEGRLIDAAGKPVANVTVQIWSRQREGADDPLDLGSCIFGVDDRLTTDADGWFRTPRALRANAMYSLTAEAPGMIAAETEAIEPATWHATRFADVVLHSLPRLRVVTGRVVDRQGRAVEGARVWQSGDGPRRSETTTDREGRFRLSHVYDGPALVFARRDGFRIDGARLGDGDSVCVIELPRSDEPAREMTGLPPRVPLNEQQKLTMSLIQPILPILRDVGFKAEHYQLLRIAARADPSRALEIADTVLADRQIKEIALQAAALALTEVDVDQAVEIAAVLKEPRDRVLVFLQSVDGLPQHAAERKRKLLAEAMLHARGDPDAGHKVYSLGQIAERWLDLGDRELGTALLREGDELAKQLPVPSKETRGDEAVHMRGRFAGSLARIDGPAALALVAGFGQPYHDWYYAGVARGWAAYDAAEAERVLDMMEPGLRFLYGLAPLHRMAAIDAQRAARLARAYPDVGERGFALGVVAHALAKSDRQMAQRLLEEAFSLLEEADRRGERSSGQAPLAVTAAALLPVAERIDARLVESYLWRSLAMRPPRPARGDPSGAYERGLAQLAALIARYDHDLAKMLLQPLAKRIRELAGQESSAPWLTLPVLMGIAVADAGWACELVNALPDAPPTAATNPKHGTSRLLAEFLCHSERSLWRTVYEFCGLRDPNLPDEEW